MTAFLVFTDFEPLLVMAPRTAAVDGRLVRGLGEKGIQRFIAHEIPLDDLKVRYGVPFEVVESDVRRGGDVRVLDSKGSHVLANVRLADLGPPIESG
jgi:hypothetical protein